ncbi:MAG: excinuclease ABC subunit UvrC [Treponema sp.]|nr:excinuclease ABC subunit UvrC [Treponema sp.]
MNSTNSIREILHQTALKAPSSSGVYLWRNPQGAVIYVGKAKNLKNRLSSYFSKGKDIKTRILISRAQSIEYITTANEYEAFLLENNLIKKYSPRYNIDLKDGKSYPVLRVTNEKFPRLFKTRQMIQDGSLYFGPFPDVAALETFMDTLYKLYPLRQCKQFRERDYPCLYYHIGRCKAPCCKKIDKDSYNAYIGEICELLEGKGQQTQEKLERDMKEAAKALNFEKAARLRDGIKALSIMQNQNIVEDFSAEDRDYIAFWREGELASFTVLKIRDGKVQGRDNYRVTSLNEDDELLPEFINAYYGEDADFPPAIYVPTQTGLDFMERWLKENFKSQTKIILVSEPMENYKRHKAALDMASQNAHEDIIRRLRERGDIPALQELKEELGLKNLPVRIEGFDIAHIGGKFPVASLISFYNGNPDKKNYRYFRLKTTNGIIDDFASMREAATRRYTRLLNEGAELPDLILIDGGIGQVNAVEGVLKALDLDIPVAGLAKRDEEIYRPGDPNPISLPKRSDALRLLQRVRDETHRFATSRNQRLRTKENVVSAFAALPGIGAKRERILTQKFVTIENLAAAQESDIAQALGVKADKAAEILMQARSLSKEREQKKEAQMQSLKEAGTTKEIAAHNEWIARLADEA